MLKYLDADGNPQTVSPEHPLPTVQAVTGTAGHVAKFDTHTSVGDSLIQDDGTGIGIGVAPDYADHGYIYIQAPADLADNSGTGLWFDTTTSPDSVAIYATASGGSGTGVAAQSTEGRAASIVQRTTEAVNVQAPACHVIRNLGGSATMSGTDPVLMVEDQTSGITPIGDLLQVKKQSSMRFRISADGRVVQTALPSAPAPLDPSQISFYLDEMGNNLKVAVTYADGTTQKTGTIPLT